MDNENQIRDLVKFQIRRNVTNLFKDLLIILEDQHLPPESYQKYRKRILDSSNNSIREIEETLDSLDIQFRKGI